MSELGESLLEAIEKAFTEDLGADRIIAGIRRRIDNAGTYADAEAYAARLGELKSRALQENITAAVLPEGRMSRDLAKEVLTPALEENYRLALEAAAQVQEGLNEAAGIGMKAVRPKLNTERIQGLVDRIGDSESFEDVSWLLGDPIVNFTQSVADETLEENAEFHAGAGLSPKIERIAEGNCCKWCAELEGEYDYDDKPRDIFRRHENCRCTVLYKPAKGKYTDVHSKKEFETQRDARIAKVEEIRAKKEREDNARRTIRERISSGRYSLKLPDQKYAEHISGTPQYKRATESRGREPSRLTITRDEAEKIIRRFSGLGDPHITKAGDVLHDEYITYHKPIGEYFDGKEWISTQRVAIVHTIDGTHIYPVPPRGAIK